MQRQFSSLTFASILLLIGTVSGCGGGGGGNDNPAPAPPAPPAPPPPPPATPGDTAALTSANRLITFDRATRAFRTGNAITGLQAGESVLGVDIRPGGTPAGELYALGSAGRIYTLNTSTGAATLRSTLAANPADSTNPFAALDGTEFGVDFNPVADRLRVVSNTGQNLRIDVETGATTTDDGLNTGGTARAGVSAAAYTNNFAEACRTTLYLLDTATDRLLSTTDPNSGAVTEVGSLGVDGDGINAHEIVTASDGSNSALAVLTVAGTPTLYAIDLTTGAATAEGGITGLDANETLRGIAGALPATAPAQAAGNVVALTETNRLISFTNAAPQKLCTSAAVTGTQSGESTLGVDRRPANGAIYAVGSTGRLYTIDPATAVASQAATLVALPADPFTALGGTEFGVDFSSVLDRLRVMSDTGQNLIVNVDNGGVETVTPLNPPGSTVTGIASQLIPSPASAFVLDIANDRLMFAGRPTGNPRNGDLLAIGPLGVGDVQSGSGFDVLGADVAFAALNIAGSAASELFRINVVTGAATRVNIIGGGERVRGLTLMDAPLVAQ